jgi:hypothetical protein
VVLLVADVVVSVSVLVSDELIAEEVLEEVLV